MKFLFGQRVIVDGDYIVVTIPPPSNARHIEKMTQTWVRFPNGIEQWRANENVKPLPGGQL